MKILIYRRSTTITNPGLMIMSASTLLAFYPFSRLAHITSAPLTYAYRVYLPFRRRCEGF
ncbi:MAG: respiratory nitrate reductase subunit gamma [Deltaproteobacteria bacterium]|nr:respiratory nitrate reductase subunit gamma [Deltaproteobacteria bacterium]